MSSGFGSDATGEKAVETPVEPGSAQDVLGRVFELQPSTEPSVPKAFGKLRPGMARADASKARPGDWGNTWSHQLADEPTVSLGAGSAEATDDPLHHLTVTFDQAGAAWRLEQAWGAPDLRAYHGGALCWIVAASRLKACVGQNLDRDVVDLSTYVPLADALGTKGGRTFTGMIKHLGTSRKDVLKAFPRGQEINDAKDPAQNRVEVEFPSTEFMADSHGDRVLFYVDSKDVVHTVTVRFGANDPAARPALVEQVKALAAPLASAGNKLSVTIIEDEPQDVVVVLDRLSPLE